jgi:hypothetical protein
MPRPGSHASRDWPLAQAALAAAGGMSLPPGARRMMARAHRAIDSRQRSEDQREHFMRTGPAQGQREAWGDAVRHVEASAFAAVRALRRWRGEPRDKDALAELVRALAQAAHAVRDSFSDGHVERDAQMRIRSLGTLHGLHPLRALVRVLGHVPRDLAMEVPGDRRTAAADQAVGDLFALVAHASLYGPADAPHVFERGFARFARAHLGQAPDPRSVPQAA